MHLCAPPSLGWGHQGVTQSVTHREGVCVDCLLRLCCSFFLVEHVSVEGEPASGFSGL